MALQLNKPMGQLTKVCPLIPTSLLSTTCTTSPAISDQTLQPAINNGSPTVSIDSRPQLPADSQKQLEQTSYV